eukprot:15432900-Alexandrium_andersonii.AAC.1
MRGGHGLSRTGVVRMKGRYARPKVCIARVRSNQNLKYGRAHDSLATGMNKNRRTLLNATGRRGR